MHPVKSLYDEDFYAWTQAQAALLRAQKASDLDYANLAEEIESLGRSERKEVRSYGDEEGVSFTSARPADWRRMKCRTVAGLTPNSSARHERRSLIPKVVTGILPQ
jgi:hypothetical protein